jgi:hypothetical protein
VNAVNPPAPLPITLSDNNLNPLAFISRQPAATPTQPGDPAANSFFYAVANQQDGLSDTLTLFYDYPPQTNSNFSKGQNVANISLPFGVIVGTTERFVPATLQISATCSGGSQCLTANVVGDFAGSESGTPQTYLATDLGVNLEFQFTQHAIFKVQTPLLVTPPTDGAYFGVNQLSGLPAAFATPGVGFAAAKLNGALVGIVPYASPQTNPNAKKNAIPNLSFCASFSTGSSGGGTVPAIAAFLAIGTDGTTYASAPMTTVAQCP